MDAAKRDYPVLGLLIDGRWTGGEGRSTRPVIDPATEAVLGDLPEATDADIAAALDASARGFEIWRRAAPTERARVLRDAGGRLRARRDYIAGLITRELGKPYPEAQREVDTAAELFEWAAEEARRLYGRLIPARTPGTRQLVLLEPFGPVAAFSGWNAPAITPARKISGALAAGCSVVIKPSEETPAVAIEIARALQEAGLPAGVLNMVFGDPGRISRLLLESPVTRMVSFTGSTAIGREIGELAARGMKRATLELGGHAPVLVFADADPESVAKAAVASKYRNAGQVCTSPTRFYVHESIVGRFTATFVEAARSLKLGDGFAADTRMGPLANERRLDAMAGFADDARARGMNIATGGERLDRPGYFWQPTVITDFHDDCRAANVEPFGPLALIKPFAGFDEVIAQANRLPFGLTAYAFTASLATAGAVAEAIESGVVCINEWAASLPETPFGGMHDSGLGSEGGIEGIQAFMRVKCIRQS
ncbi:MAG: NAD-dependent succinate-semialdehyde dehydrogenase [Burkholderiaceae bacterium]|jgi:succinate-semialdehyde dehydrogenase/glutarate-semialdehyde dehydrogenase|nr:NAD-dependent succinate-semialdehyde dehydrogenase [Burkholderiaceae bacterium]MEB2319922.1 NAD-dependent succinate-semialdehyde dehydrogenase [Pseudomonadota bacterium]